MQLRFGMCPYSGMRSRSIYTEKDLEGLKYFVRFSAVSLSPLFAVYVPLAASKLRPCPGTNKPSQTLLFILKFHISKQTYCDSVISGAVGLSCNVQFGWCAN